MQLPHDSHKYPYSWPMRGLKNAPWPHSLTRSRHSHSLSRGFEQEGKQLCYKPGLSGRTSVRYRFGSPFSSKRLWFVDTVLWLCPSLPTETLKWFSSLPTLMQKSFWWWQCSDRYIISLSPTSILPSPHFSPYLISLMVSVAVKHLVYLLTNSVLTRLTNEPQQSLADSWKLISSRLTVELLQCTRPPHPFLILILFYFYFNLRWTFRLFALSLCLFLPCLVLFLPCLLLRCAYGLHVDTERAASLRSCTTTILKHWATLNVVMSLSALAGRRCQQQQHVKCISVVACPGPNAWERPRRRKRTT